MAGDDAAPGWIDCAGQGAERGCRIQVGGSERCRRTVGKGREEKRRSVKMSSGAALLSAKKDVASARAEELGRPVVVACWGGPAMIAPGQPVADVMRPHPPSPCPCSWFLLGFSSDYLFTHE